MDTAQVIVTVAGTALIAAVLAVLLRTSEQAAVDRCHPSAASCQLTAASQ